MNRNPAPYYYSNQQLGIDRRTKALVIERCLTHAHGPLVLDLGYVDGSWTDPLVVLGHKVDVVEGVARHAKRAQRRYRANPAVRVFNTLFQNFEPDRRYDTIVAGDMIRYLEDPLTFLHRAKGWLKPDGVIIVTVPNSRSMHRRAGALMGLERRPTDANARDIEVGNLRGYDRYELRALLLDAGLAIKALHGCFLKPLSSVQIEDWDDRLLRAFLALGDELEDYCWFLYAVCAAGPKGRARHAVSRRAHPGAKADKTGSRIGRSQAKRP